MLLSLDKDLYPFMKIILIHSSQRTSRKIPWLYFGSSYLKMKRLERQLSGDRINLQKTVLNLNNNNFPVDEYLDKIESSGLDVKVIETSFANIEDI